MSVCCPPTMWPIVASTAQLPNKAGATIQSSALQPGDACPISGGVVYYCVTPTMGGATWSLSAPSVSAGGLLLGSFVANTSGVIQASYFGGKDISVSNAVHNQTGTFVYTLSGADLPSGVTVTAAPISGVITSCYAVGASVTVNTGTVATLSGRVLANAYTGNTGLVMAEYVPGSGVYEFGVNGLGSTFNPVASIVGGAQDKGIGVQVMGSPASTVRVTTYVQSTLAAADADFTLDVSPVALQAGDAYHTVFVSRAA